MIIDGWDIVTEPLEGHDTLVFIWHIHDGKRANMTTIRMGGGVLSCRSCRKTPPPEIDGLVNLLAWEK